MAPTRSRRATFLRLRESTLLADAVQRAWASVATVGSSMLVVVALDRGAACAMTNVDIM